MTIHEARMIRELKKRCTMRRLAEIYYPETQDAHGVYGYGEDLVKEALETLYPGMKLWGESVRPDHGAKFREDNLSYLGGFYWWE